MDYRDAKEQWLDECCEWLSEWLDRLLPLACISVLGFALVDYGLFFGWVYCIAGGLLIDVGLLIVWSRDRSFPRDFVRSYARLMKDYFRP